MFLIRYTHIYKYIYIYIFIYIHICTYIELLFTFERVAWSLFSDFWGSYLPQEAPKKSQDRFEMAQDRSKKSPSMVQEAVGLAEYGDASRASRTLAHGGLALPPFDSKKKRAHTPAQF